MANDQSQEQTRGHQRGTERREDSFFFCCNAELEPKFPKYKGRIVLRGDTVKDDSGSCAVFTELGSSASEMMAAKGMDDTARLPGCAGQAADAVSALYPSQNGGSSALLKLPK